MYFVFKLCNLPQNNLRDTIIDIKANKIELQIEDILTEVSGSLLFSSETPNKSRRMMSKTFFLNKFY